jgi:hypothetical protein
VNIYFLRISLFDYGVLPQTHPPSRNTRCPFPTHHCSIRRTDRETSVAPVGGCHWRKKERKNHNRFCNFFLSHHCIILYCVHRELSMGKLSKCRACCKGAGARWFSLLRLSLHEIRKRKLSYCLGFMACLIAVLVIAITVTIMNHMPAVFFLLGESEEGECDLIVQTPLEEDDVRHPGALRFNAAINLGVIPDESSPRIQIETASFKSSVSSTSSRSADIVVFVTEREDSMRLGRKWDYDPIPKGHVFLAKQVARELGVSEGSMVYANIPLFPYLRAATQEYCTNTTCSKEVSEGDRLEAPDVPLRVEEVLKKTYGKVGNSMNRVVFMEYDNFLESTLPYVKDADVSASVKSAILQKWSLRDSATRFMINLSSPRLDHYNHNNYDVIQDKVSKWGAMILYRLGFNQVAPSMPLLLSMRASRFFSLFMGLIVVMVATILGGLSIILIYSLLMIHVETKTFELGILRMIGMSRLSLIEMVMIHAFLYSIPAWIVGLGLAELLAIAYAKYVHQCLLAHDIPSSKSFPSYHIFCLRFLWLQCHFEFS